ncbi:MAG: polysaccharide deacetylase family protein [Sulfitobacter sp.]|nr:polysaccharide deacetylase family protein [Sulfitobacter sp.]
MTDFSPLRDELAIWRAEGLTLPLWWRDDDAVGDTPALRRLLNAGRKLGLPLHLAVIPQGVAPTLTEACKDYPETRLLVHGYAHLNHAPQGSKKAEFGHPRPGMATEAASGLAQLRGQFGAAVLPVFVPPWNRVDPDFALDLNRLGYSGLSTFTPRDRVEVAAGVVQVNTHLDPINWRGGGGLVDPATLIAQLVQHLKDRRAGRADATEPLGILTHHLVHDADIWAFSEACIGCLLDRGATPADLTAAWSGGA